MHDLFKKTSDSTFKMATRRLRLWNVIIVRLCVWANKVAHLQYNDILNIYTIEIYQQKYLWKVFYTNDANRWKQHNSPLKALILWYLTFRVKRDTPKVIWHHVWFVPMHPSSPWLFLIPSGWYDLLHFLMTSNEINFVF